MFKKHKNKQGGGESGAVYGLGVIGAAIYFIQNANTFMDGVIGLFKAILWPAILIHKVLTVLSL